MQALLADRAQTARLRIDHPSYRHEAALAPDTRASLLADLRDECAPLLPPERWRDAETSPPTDVIEETARVRVLRLTPTHRVVEPAAPLGAGSLLGAGDEALTLELARTVERHASALRSERGAVRISIDTTGDRPRWHLVAGD
jgi:hypothetical protein